MSVRVLHPKALQPESVVSGDQIIDCEDSMAEAFANSEMVFADPLFSPVCPANVRFIRFPHEAFSGRCFSGEIKNYICRELKREMFAL